MHWFLLCIGLGPLLCAGAVVPEIDFATVAQGRELLMQRDDYVTRMSPFDRAARMKTDKDVAERQYLDFVGAAVLPWKPDEESSVRAAWRELSPELARLALPFPNVIHFVKTNGAGEGDAEYTRANEIVFPQSAFKKDRLPSLKGTIAHELFHILSRNNPGLRDELYATIGFEPCGEIPFPPALASRKLTDPDAPKNDHCIHLRLGREPLWAVPLLYSKVERFDPAKGGEFFQFIEMRFLRVERKSATAEATYNMAAPQLLDLSQLSGFYEQVGRNTQYIIHPEEILADNFEFLLIGKKDLPSPEVRERLAKVLGQTAESR